MNSPFRCIEIPYYDFVICVISNHNHNNHKSY